MSYEATSYMLVGFKYQYDDFKDMAIEWLKSTNANFKDSHKKQLEVVKIMPSYQKDLDSLNQQALEEFYEHLDEQNVLRVSEQHGWDYIGFSVDAVVEVDDNSLSEFCKTVQAKSAQLYNLLGKKGSLMSVHDYN